MLTLDEDGKLFMEITIDRGRGYVSSDQNKELIQGHNRCYCNGFDLSHLLMKVNYYDRQYPCG